MKKFETVKRVNKLKNGNIEIVLRDHKDGSQSSIILVFDENGIIEGYTEIFAAAHLNKNKNYIEYEVPHE